MWLFEDEPWQVNLKEYLRKTLFVDDFERQMKIEEFTEKHTKEITDKIKQELNRLTNDMAENCKQLDKRRLSLDGE